MAQEKPIEEVIAEAKRSHYIDRSTLARLTQELEARKQAVPPTAKYFDPGLLINDRLILKVELKRSWVVGPTMFLRALPAEDGQCVTVHLTLEEQDRLQKLLVQAAEVVRKQRAVDELQELIDRVRPTH